MEKRTTPRILGIHHVRLPVSDLSRARDWYREVLGLVPVLDYEEEEGPVGIVLSHESGMTVGLHHDPTRADALRGFCILALEVGTQAALHDWVAHLDTLDVSHAGIRDGHLGLLVEVPDPDGILVQLHTTEHPSADEA